MEVQKMNRNTSITFLLATLALLLLFGLSNAVTIEKAAAWVYWQENYTSYVHQITGSVGIAPGDWSNDVMSIRIEGGAKVTLYDGENYTGASLGVTQSIPNLDPHGWGDRASSWKVFWPQSYLFLSNLGLGDSLGNLYLASRDGARQRQPYFCVCGLSGWERDL